MVAQRRSDAKFFDLEIEVKSAVPIYEQIKNAVKIAILSEKLSDGDKLVSIREIASRYNINPITIMKAYGQLEAEGYLFSRRGSGYFVQLDAEKKGNRKSELLHRELTDFLKKIGELGFTGHDLMVLLKKILGEEK